MFEGRAALYRIIRTLARTVERERARQMAGPQFDAWLGEHRYIGRDLPLGARSKTVAWSAAEEWPGSIEWYVLDDSVIGASEHGGLFYEIPFADLAHMPALVDPRSIRRGLEHSRLQLHRSRVAPEPEGDTER
jgi:hypothetical protein